ncbi:ribosome maturation factor RimP [Neisseria sp. Ec49-e6-T10]|uniref:ribosome maturation factor RimP n=1 Tax=Neisseria sp. Ec49-e6-T10 TaxID=3140744 RepID=UPI003EBAAB96
MSVQELLDKTLPGLGYELVDYELAPNGNMRIFIDKEGGVSIDDCVNVSNHLTRLFLAEEVNYNRLEVSSPGLDRPLKKEADFERFVGQLVKVKVRLPIDGQKKFLGKIIAFENQKLTLSFDQKEVIIEFSNIDKARLEPEF